MIEFTEKNLLYEKYERIELPYELEDLDSIIDFNTMRFHYDVLHKNYEVGLMKILRGSRTEEKSEIEQQFPTLVKLMENLDKLPSKKREDVRFFGGGLLNHNFFFLNLTKFNEEQKNPEARISPELSKLIQEYVERKHLSSHLPLKNLTNLEKLEEALVESALKVRGSGWTWLVLDQNNKLEIINTANQDGPWALKLKPLIAIDVWEHAYVLYYGANRKKYVERLVKYLLNWEFINQQLD